MRLASFRTQGKPSYGIVTDGGIIDAGAKLGARFATLRAALAGNALAEIARLNENTAPTLKLADVMLELPIPEPDKIVCIGLNYRAHAAEAGSKIPEFPMLFIRFANSVVPHGQAMVRPKLSGDFDYEGELAIVIGKAGRHIDKAKALEHIAGYTILNDGSIRDYQFKHCLAVGKNFHASGAVGPWMTTADEIPDPSKLTLVTRLNGQEVQRTGTDDLIFDVPYIINYVSSFTELVPGDIIATGTPHGVAFARKPPLWMKPGDTVEIEISRIGTLRNPVIAEA